MDDIFVASCNEMTVNITRFLIISKIVCSLFKCKKTSCQKWMVNEDQSFINFENNTVKLSVNKAKNQ